MKLGEFIKKFSHNNLIRLHYDIRGGHELVGKNWDVVSMDWEVNKKRGPFKKYINREVYGLVSILCASSDTAYPEAINICIERL